MRPRSRVFSGVCLLCFGILLPYGLSAQDQERSYRLQPGFGVEYMSQTIVWDEKTYSSPLNMGMALFRFGVELKKGPTFGILAGYGLNNWNGLVFRQLPFSIDYQNGAIGSILLGFDVDQRVLTAGDWEIGLTARFLASIGSSQVWTLTDLLQPLQLDGRADWLQIQAGPSLTYRGFETFSPFLSVFYDRLWGTFTLNENVQTLTGVEEKKFAGRGFIGVSAGLWYDPSPFFRLKATGTLIPYGKLAGGLGFDFGASLRAVLSF
jgi:hypothetical protein